MWKSRAKASANDLMIRAQITPRGLTDDRINQAMRATDRRLFVPEGQEEFAYEDRPLPLCPGATVSQPYIVAVMTELLNPQPAEKILEVGTGSGYQAAILSLLCKEVYSIEVQPELVEYARARLDRVGRQNVTVVTGDGWNGLPDYAPFDGIIVTAAPATIPEKLSAQLKPGGRMVIPTGKAPQQNLQVLRKSLTGDITVEEHSPVQFVPMIHAPDNIA